MVWFIHWQGTKPFITLLLHGTGSMGIPDQGYTVRYLEYLQFPFESRAVVGVLCSSWIPPLQFQLVLLCFIIAETLDQIVLDLNVRNIQ